HPHHQRPRDQSRGLEVDGSARAMQEWDPLPKVVLVVVPGGKTGAGMGGHEVRGEGLDQRAELRHRPEAAIRVHPAVPGQGTQWLLLVSGFESTGKRRTPTPNRKIVAAIRPSETPHSTREGQ